MSEIPFSNYIKFLIFRCIYVKWNILYLDKTQIEKMTNINNLCEDLSCFYNPDVKVNKDLVLKELYNMKKYAVDHQYLLTLNFNYVKVELICKLQISMFTNVCDEVMKKFNLPLRVETLFKNFLGLHTTVEVNEIVKQKLLNNALINNFMTDLYYFATISTDSEELALIKEKRKEIILSNPNINEKLLLCEMELKPPKRSLLEVSKSDSLRKICSNLGIKTASKKVDMASSIEKKITEFYFSTIRKLSDDEFKTFLFLTALNQDELNYMAEKLKIPLEQDIFSLRLALANATIEESLPKKNIPSVIKDQVWDKYMGNVKKAKCFCCRQKDIKATSFHAGHIISEKNGGQITVENLRPVCIDCNFKMGTEDMREYAKREFSVII